MRDIKFRAWIKAESVMTIVRHINFEDKYVRVYTTNTKLITARFSFNQIELMQYTGIKDCNGIEIYEGDILTDHSLVNDFGTAYKAHVEFSEGAFRLMKSNCDCGNCEDTVLDDATEMQIIGNIYEN